MTSPTLNEQEVDALMDAIQGEGVDLPEDAEVGAVFPYDLTSQDRIIRGQMPTLDSINERVASVFATRLSARIRLAVDIRTNPASMMKFSDFRALVGPAMTVALIGLGPGFGSAVMVLEAGLAERLIACALGDRQAEASPVMPEDGRYDLTTVDRLVLGSLLSHFTSAMADAWAQILPLSPEVLSFESDPRMVAIASPNDVVILCTFELSGALSGDLQLGIPFSVVEPVKKSLSSPSHHEGGANLRFSRGLVGALLETKVGVRVELGTRATSVEELMRLEVGDVVALDTSADSLLPVTVEGRTKLWVRPHSTPGGLVAVVVRGLGVEEGTGEGTVGSGAPPAESPAGADEGDPLSVAPVESLETPTPEQGRDDERHPDHP